MSKALDKLQTIFAKMFEEEKKMKGKDPCWKGYEMIGMKKKNGKEVPNCVPKNEEVEITEAKVGDTVSFHHELKSAPGSKVKKSGTVEKVDGDVVHVKVKDKYGVKRHQIKMGDLVKEEVDLDEEHLDEVSQDALRNYFKKSVADLSKRQIKMNTGSADSNDAKKMQDRKKGLSKASDKIASKMEEVEQVDEISTELKQKYLDAATKKHLQQFLGRAPVRGKQELDKRRAAIQKTSKELTGKTHYREEVELDEAFSDAQIARLKTEYSKISGIDPDSESYKKLIALLDKQDKATLQKLADSGIKFISGLARNRVIRMKEEVELDEVSMEKLQKYFAKGVKDLSNREIRINTGKAAADDAKKSQDRKKGLTRAAEKIGAKMEEVDLDQLFTEAMKVKKKSEETPTKKSIKKGEPLSGKQEPVKVHPEIQTRN